MGSLFKALVNQKSEKTIHTHGYADLVKVVITTLSILLFNYEDSSGGESSSKMDAIKTILFGYGFLILSLLFDGILALKEKIINHEVHNNPEYAEYKSSLSWGYMSLFSLFSTIFCGFVLLYEFYCYDSFKITLIEYINNREILTNILFYAFMSSIGQVFIFQFLEKWGPLTLSIITGVRKILSIALSIIFFGKAVSFIKIISLLLGTTVISWEISEKTSGKGGHGHGHGSTPKVEEKNK